MGKVRLSGGAVPAGTALAGEGSAGQAAAGDFGTEGSPGGYPCKVLCLDKDGLLFDSTAFWMELFRQREIALADVLDAGGLALWKSLSGVEAGNGGGKGTVSVDERIDRQGPFALAYPRDEMVIAASAIYHTTKQPWDVCLRMAVDRFRLADESLDWERALKPLPGFPDIIRRAKDAGIAVAIVTSDDEARTDYSMRLYGVRDDVDLICTPAHVENGKPHPDMLQYVARWFDCGVAELVMVGDSIVDVEMARNAGCLGVGIPHPEARHLFGEYVTVGSLRDIEFGR